MINKLAIAATVVAGTFAFSAAADDLRGKSFEVENGRAKLVVDVGGSLVALSGPFKSDLKLVSVDGMFTAACVDGGTDLQCAVRRQGSQSESTIVIHSGESGYKIISSIRDGLQLNPNDLVTTAANVTVPPPQPGPPGPGPIPGPGVGIRPPTAGVPPPCCGAGNGGTHAHHEEHHETIEHRDTVIDRYDNEYNVPMVEYYERRAGCIDGACGGYTYGPGPLPPPCCGGRPGPGGPPPGVGPTSYGYDPYGGVPLVGPAYPPSAMGGASVYYRGPAGGLVGPAIPPGGPQPPPPPMYRR